MKRKYMFEVVVKLRQIFVQPYLIGAWGFSPLKLVLVRYGVPLKVLEFLGVQ